MCLHGFWQLEKEGINELILSYPSPPPALWTLVIITHTAASWKSSLWSLFGVAQPLDCISRNTLLWTFTQIHGLHSLENLSVSLSDQASSTARWTRQPPRVHCRLGAARAAGFPTLCSRGVDKRGSNPYQSIHYCHNNVANVAFQLRVPHCHTPACLLHATGRQHGLAGTVITDHPII